MNTLVSKLALMLVLVVTQTFSSFGQSKYWGFNYSNTLDFSTATPTIPPVATTAANTPAGPDLKGTNAHTIYDDAGNILFSVTSAGFFDKFGVNVAGLFVDPGTRLSSEIEIFPNGETCGHYYVAVASTTDLVLDSKPLYLYEVDASNPLAITVVLKDELCKYLHSIIHSSASYVYGADADGARTGLVATTLDINNSRKLYLLCGIEDKSTTPPYYFINQRFVMKSWEFKADGTYIELPEVPLDYGGPFWGVGLGDRMGRVSLMEATPNGQYIGYTGPFGLRVYNTSTGTITNYPITALSSHPGSTINGIEYVVGPDQVNRWYVSYTYYDGTTFKGTMGYFEEGITTILHSTGGALQPTFGASDLELGKDNRLYFANCPTCPLNWDFIPGGHHPIGSSLLYNTYANSGNLYSFDPLATTPVYSLVSGVSVKQSTYEARYYYLNNQIDGEDMSTWDASAPSKVADALVNLGPIVSYPSPCPTSPFPPFASLQIEDVSNLFVYFKDAIGNPVSLSINEEYSISWIEIDPCGLTPVPSSSLNYTDGWHSGSGPIDLSTYGSGVLSSPASLGKYFGVTIKIRNKCTENEQVYNAFIQIDNFSIGCNSSFTINTTSHTSGGVMHTIPDKSVNLVLDDHHPTSNYYVDYGDGTGVHTYVPGTPFYTYTSPGSYTICLTETTSTGTSCKTCYDFCFGVAYSVALADTTIPNPTGFGFPCNSSFTANLTLHTAPLHSVTGLGFLIPDRSISLELDNINLGSTYTVDYGDGTGTHPYSGAPSFYTYALPGSYTVCITETMSNGSRCRTCYSFCIGAAYSEVPLKRSQNEIYISTENASEITLAPNPTQLNTELKILISQKDNVKVAVIDMTGKMVLDVFNGHLDEGVQKLNINTENLASGLYQVRVMIGNKVSSHKLSVIK